MLQVLSFPAKAHSLTCLVRCMVSISPFSLWVVVLQVCKKKKLTYHVFLSLCQQACDGARKYSTVCTGVMWIHQSPSLSHHLGVQQKRPPVSEDSGHQLDQLLPAEDVLPCSPLKKMEVNFSSKNPRSGFNSFPASAGTMCAQNVEKIGNNAPKRAIKLY